MKTVNGLTPYAGPAIRMLKEDHRDTVSANPSLEGMAHKGRQQALINQGKFLAAQQLGIDDIRKKFGDKYDKAIAQMVAYTKNALGYTQ
ncbi:MAG: hypothetical protein HQK65_23495 [Desulfamplus sp.]|nr:hypothetical protein [Desulfamplus sp.]